jgi:hypothetical protein
MMAFNETAMSVTRAVAGVVGDPLLRAFCVTVLCELVLLVCNRVLLMCERALAIWERVLVIRQYYDDKRDPNAGET